MRTWILASFALAALLIALHVHTYLRSHPAARDPNGYELMIAFFYGVPLALAAAGVSFTALKKTKKKVFWVPLSIGLLPLVGWPTIFALEFMRIIP